VFVFTLAAVVIASLTIGQDIYEHNDNGYMSFAIVNFFGYLFVFLFMPVELAFIYYLRSGFDPVILSAIAFATALAAQIIDYVFGYFFSTHIIEKLIGQKRFEKAEDEIRKYGNWTLFFSNLLPLSSPVISLAAGMLKYPPKDALLYSIAGMTGRYLLLVIIF
jgi:membrane protein YqaA with SNARE-associated domain